MGFLGLIGRGGGEERRTEIMLTFLVHKQVSRAYCRKLEQGHFAYLNGGMPFNQIETSTSLISG